MPLLRSLPAASSGGAAVLSPVACGGRSCDSGGVVATPDDLVRDHRGEQERALQDLADLRRDADRAEALGRTLDRRPHDGRRGDTDGSVAAEQRDAEPGEADLVGKASPYLRKLGSDSRNGRPIIPATAPDMNSVISTIFFGFTPADRAAAGLRPDKRSS